MKEADLSRLVAVVFRVHKGLIVYYLKMAHCGDLQTRDEVTVATLLW